MAKNSNEVVKIVTPRGVAKWPHLQVPDTKFKESGEYRLDFVIPEDEAEELLAQIDELNEKFYAKAKEGLKPVEAKRLVKATPYKREEDDEGQETGNIIITFKRDAVRTTKEGVQHTFKPEIYDAAGSLVTEDLKIGTGTVLKVSCIARPMGTNPLKLAGVKLLFKAAQVIELTQWGGGTAESNGFGKEEGGFTVSKQESAAPSDDMGDDDADF